MTDLFTPEQYRQQISNGMPENYSKDHYPVVRLHILFTGCEWLLTELNPEEPNIAFGLCDLGQGFPELGYVDLDEVRSVKTVPFPVMQDVFFKGEYPISVYADAARSIGAITIDSEEVKRFVKTEPTPDPSP
ncbi:DUF2958 domain-containing protein [Niabella hibiscisoli]|uniref:DUF2958 domain-containing protein n=1 Tax=Niabella hibiscisoli TaxID=1825928 RepID=UPI001F0FF0AC|nr:DUF2958 domain-containing protein [Niabella hibiscisoli]MCH5716694.1 DUF2958 domain-containing protein [Niabella hibiscisoli]